jgi:hypothetical protein
MKRLCFALTLAALSVSAVNPAGAGTIALSSFSGGFVAGAGQDQLWGWVFTANSPISVTAVGVFDTDSDGLAVSHDVGIFRQSDQSLLAAATIPEGVGGFLDSGFRFVSLGGPVALGIDTYVIVMTMPDHNPDNQNVSNTSVTTASQIIYVDSAFGLSAVLAFPTTNGILPMGFFGPNFIFESAAVPEPGPAMLLIAGLGALLIRRHASCRTR